ncbi:hypothetical protein M378DRAFT_164331 [Amanita muscaria Koide BX008]|uniref:Uncharacterized protein n=1 Tax=Amanita muscaria (strain Koide BX008) TaxID=946122 RepID=A0A0C2TAC7_AMAMK|nr:hypothetical protein M378DRAFT_164331 [Amanita muscaria Koide BX008]
MRSHPLQEVGTLQLIPAAIIWIIKLGFWEVRLTRGARTWRSAHTSPGTTKLC